MYRRRKQNFKRANQHYLSRRRLFVDNASYQYQPVSTSTFQLAPSLPQQSSTQTNNNLEPTSDFVNSMFQPPSPSFSVSSTWSVSFLEPLTQSRETQTTSTSNYLQDWPEPVARWSNKPSQNNSYIRPCFFKEWPKNSTNAVKKFEERTNALSSSSCELNPLWHCGNTFQILEVQKSEKEVPHHQWLYAREMIGYYPKSGAPYEEVKFWYKVAKNREEFFSMAPQCVRERSVSLLHQRRGLPTSISPYTPQHNSENRNARFVFPDEELHTVNLNRNNQPVTHTSRIFPQVVLPTSEYERVREWLRNLQCRMKMEGKCLKTLQWNKEAIKQVMNTQGVFKLENTKNHIQKFGGKTCALSVGCGDTFTVGDVIKMFSCKKHFAHFSCFAQYCQTSTDEYTPFMVKCSYCRKNTGIRFDAPITAQGWNRIAHGMKWLVENPLIESDMEEDEGFYYATWDNVEREASSHIWNLGNLKQAYPGGNANNHFRHGRYLQEVTEDSDFDD